MCASDPVTGQYRIGPANEAGDDTANSGELQEVVVSAQKREESINKVPISVAVLGRDEMEQRSVKDFGDVAAVAAGVPLNGRNATWFSGKRQATAVDQVRAQHPIG